MSDIEVLAGRRHAAWKRLSDPCLPPEHRHNTAQLVRRLTRDLNGHDNPHVEYSHRPGDGLFAAKRKARLPSA